jgi:hypothetical protein
MGDTPVASTPEAPPELPTDLVFIKHPDFDPASTPGTVTREAFDTIYADKGFVIVDDAGEPVAKAKAAPAAKASTSSTGGNPA